MGRGRARTVIAIVWVTQVAVVPCTMTSQSDHVRYPAPRRIDNAPPASPTNAMMAKEVRNERP